MVTKKKKTKAKPAKKKAAAAMPLVLDRVAKTFVRLEHERSMRKGVGGMLVPPEDIHADARGLIANIVNEPVGAVAVIHSKAGTVRANHYHKEDAHLCYVVSGRIQYAERPAGLAGFLEAPAIHTIEAGQSFYTGPLVEHAMKFLEDTVFITLGRLSRTQAAYEKDLVRLKSVLLVPDVTEPTASVEAVTPTPEETPAPRPTV